MRASLQSMAPILHYVLSSTDKALTLESNLKKWCEGLSYKSDAHHLLLQKTGNNILMEFPQIEFVLTMQYYPR